MADIRGRGRAGRGAGTGFIGEQPPLHPVHDHCAQASCCRLAEPESLRKNPLEDRGQHAGILHNHSTLTVAFFLSTITAATATSTMVV